MAELIAQGRKPEDRWRRQLPADQAVVLGRDAGDWAVSWDEHVSRRHLTLTWHDGRLEVQRLPTGRNPVFRQGAEADQFQLLPGSQFVIGETVFTLVDDPQPTLQAARPLVKERTFSAQELTKLKVRDAAHQIDVLSRLPQVISGTANERELFAGLVNLLLAGISLADVAALVSVEPASGAEPAVRLLYWDRRQAIQGDFQPSDRLIREAMQRQQTVLHVWAGQVEDSFTPAASFDWAFCTPMRGDPGNGWGIYVAGRFDSDLASTVLEDRETSGLSDDLKFTELMAAIWSSLHQVQQLQRREAVLGHFFSPTVLRTMNAAADPDAVLKPRQADLTVLFCDLRGFSREAEKHAGELLPLLERISKALGLMTQNILDQEGVIGDFLGDAALGFWGWPNAQPDSPRRACLAALGIRALFEAVSQRTDHSLAGFRVGIGIASGPAVAGKLGTADQFKVSVFGPVVNLASRLEGMTKILRVPILLDETTSRGVREQVPATVARVRRLALVQPYGMDTTLTVSELLPPVSEYPLLSDAHLAEYETALDALLRGQWPQALECLYQLPPQDRGKDFLTAFIIQNNYTPPSDWNEKQFIPMSSK